MTAKPKIGIILTGGTIDSAGRDRLDLAWYIEAGKRIDNAELFARIPELRDIAEVQEIPFRRLPSQALIDKDWFDLVDTIHTAIEKDKLDGVVVTHGTNTLEETAYFSAPDAQDDQAGRPGRRDAPIIGCERRRISEHHQCGADSRFRELPWARLSRRNE
jgi:Asparaginase, N-terminal